MRTRFFLSAIPLMFLIVLCLGLAVSCGTGADSAGDDDDDGALYDDDDDASASDDDDDASDDDDDDSGYYDDDDDDDDDDIPDYACPEDTSSTVLFLSADDSNSQASPVVARAIIEQGGIMPSGKVRTYEFTNYYSIDYAAPAFGEINLVPQLRPRSNSQFATEYTLQIGAQSHQTSERRSIALTLSLDTSGSMAGQSMSMLRETCKEIASELRAGDIVSMVEWDNSTNVMLNSHTVSGSNDPTLLAIINNLSAGGSTDLHGGLVRAYELAEDNYQSGWLNRVVLISDGQANTGVTDINLIAGAADDSEGEGIYLVGVGVGDAYNYFNDTLMDKVTDAGKGAFVYIDTAAEALKQFSGSRFFANMEIAALDVRVRLEMPYYLIMDEFHGEQMSEDPDQVDPQHLGPNDAMVYHQFLVACDEALVEETDTIDVSATYTDPFTLENKSVQVEMTIAQMLAANADQLLKGDAIVTYAEALKRIDQKIYSDPTAALQICQEAKLTVETARTALGGDADLTEIAALLQTYETTISSVK
jgi:Ca-activated chloride channel homolog